MFKSFSMDLAGRKLTVEIGRVAAQANGAAFMHYGDTVVLSTATASSKPSIPPRCRPTGDFSAANTFPGPTNICKASERHRFCGKHNNF